MDMPPWLNDAPEISKLLSVALDRFDRQSGEQRQRDVLLAAESAVPALQRGDAQADQLWCLLEDLQQRNALRIRRGKRDPYAAPWQDAKLAFAPDSETLLRTWLQRPRIMPATQIWREAVQRHAMNFPGDITLLQERPLAIAGRSAEEVVQALLGASAVQEVLTLRQLSARLFWGDSKVLDERGELIAALFPASTIRERAIVVSVFLPEHWREVLFIENQDTYTAACRGAWPPGTALVYAAGFRTTATRIRMPEGAQLHYSGPGLTQWAIFSDWWFMQRPQSGAVFFWGDLDFAGMQILKSLRERFGEVSAWQPGYAPMLEVLVTRGGHGRDAAQLDPGSTGCEYADQVLLPAIRQRGLVDQESVSTLQAG